MFDLPDDKDEALRLAELGCDALDIIAKLVGGATAGTSASVVTVLRIILKTVSEGYEGKVTVEKVRAEIQKFADDLAVNDEAADQALKDKFKKDSN